jgi:UDP-N-acetylglucosamine 4,6-dehydratase (inverting)
MLNNKQILITGGTGSFGRAFVAYLFKNYVNIKRIVVFSRDEQKQFEMALEFSPKEYAIDYILGDVRDKEQLYRAMKNIDILIHSAAMKHVGASEQNPMECVKTNILGSQNIIDVAMEREVKQVVALSTDKSANPINVYGASKLILEKLFIMADAQKMEQNIKFSLVRYGNIFGTKGSVVPFFMKKKKEGILPITDVNMTRFSMTIQESIDLVMYALNHAWGGEIFIPKVSSYKIIDIAKAIAPHASYPIVGKRKGEKIDEVLFSSEESYDTLERDNVYIICPSDGRWTKEEYIEKTNAKVVNIGKEYNSKENDYLSVGEIEKLIESEKII